MLMRQSQMNKKDSETSRSILRSRSGKLFCKTCTLCLKYYGTNTMWETDVKVCRPRIRTIAHVDISKPQTERLS